MSQTDIQLKRIQEKVRELVRSQAALQKENAKLHSALEEAKAKQSAAAQTTEELKQQVAVLKMNTGSLPAADKKELEKKINGYLKEIDRCIALLGE